MLRTVSKSVAVASLLLACLFAVQGFAAEAEQKAAAVRQPDVGCVPTPHDVVEKMLEMAGVKETDVVYDLGCGDGRIPIAAVESFGVERAVCIEIDGELLDRAREAARAAGVEDRIDFVEGDLFQVDLAPASIVTLYLFPEVNLRLRPKLQRELAPGARVGSHHFDMGDWMADQRVQAFGATLYLWALHPSTRSP